MGGFCEGKKLLSLILSHLPQGIVLPSKLPFGLFSNGCFHHRTLSLSYHNLIFMLWPELGTGLCPLVCLGFEMSPGGDNYVLLDFDKSA